MSKQAIIRIKNSVGNVLSSLLAKDGFDCDCRNDVPLDLITFQTKSDTGVFFVWADDFYQKGVVDAVSWFTRLRIAEKSKWHNWPVIILGYDSYPTFLRYFKAPRILASHGVEYIQLPCSLRALKEAVGKIVPPSDAQIRDYIQDHDHARRLGDRLTHDIGNFYAMFRLLDGAYLDGRLTEYDYNNARRQVEEIQRSNPKLSNDLAYKEFMFLRSSSIVKAEPPTKPPTSQSIASGKKILLIDDAVTFGWAHVLAYLLTGDTDFTETVIENLELKILENSNFRAIGRINPFDSATEDAFINSLNAIIKAHGKTSICEADLIFLDLRLRRNADEKIPADQCSGIDILKKIRELNAGVPVIMFTASRKAESLEAVIQLGANGYFIKDPGVTDEGSDNIKSYYQDFASNIDKTLTRTFHRDIWIGIEKAKVNDEVRGFFKQAFALIRQRPSKFDMEELFYTPYAAAIVALGNAIEKYVEKGSSKKKYGAKMEEFYSMHPDLMTFAHHIGFLRNISAHPTEVHTVCEYDVRIAFILALRSIKGVNEDSSIANRILVIERPEKIEIIVRKAFSYLRKKTNCLGKNSYPKFIKRDAIEKICEDACNSYLTRTYLSFLIHSACGIIGLKDYEILLLTNVLERYSTLVSAKEDTFKPQYEKGEMNFPCIKEAFWDVTKKKWFIPGDREIGDDCVNTTFEKKYEGHTQSFLFQHSTDFEAWGPPIPFGDYTEDELRKMLTVNSQVNTNQMASPHSTAKSCAATGNRNNNHAKAPVPAPAKGVSGTSTKNGAGQFAKGQNTTKGTKPSVKLSSLGTDENMKKLETLKASLIQKQGEET